MRHVAVVEACNSAINDPTPNEANRTCVLIPQIELVVMPHGKRPFTMRHHRALNHYIKYNV
jgi:hypothetical protein